jgi:hypothetical protein
MRDFHHAAHMLPDSPPSPPEAPPALVFSTELKRNHLVAGESTAPSMGCLFAEADRQHIDPYILLALLRTEGGRAGEYALNRNGSVDLGPMSINTVWLPALAKHYRTPENELKYRLATDGCANVAAAALILKRRIAATGNVPEGVASYHSNNPAKAGRYLMRVHDRLSQIVAKLKARALQEPAAPTGIARALASAVAAPVTAYRNLNWDRGAAYVPMAGANIPSIKMFDWAHAPDYVPTAGAQLPGISRYDWAHDPAYVPTAGMQWPVLGN